MASAEPVLPRTRAAIRRADALCRRSVLIDRMALHTTVEAIDDRYAAWRCRSKGGPHARQMAECGRVLVVDDTQDVGGVITRGLRMAGFWAYHAHSCGEAFEVLADRKITLLVLDVGDWSLGLALLDILEVASRLPKVIGLTGGWRETAVDPRICAVVTRPVEVNALMRLVGRLARLSPNTAGFPVPNLELAGSSVT